MKVKNGYILCLKKGKKHWRKLPHLVWLRIQRAHILKASKNRQRDKDLR